jgi:L-ascorbate metabolism protein UlaG (beta-lactamase superfamily)
VKSVTVSIRWLGHAGFEIKADSKVIYVDLYRAKKYEGRVPDVSDPATLVLVTHSHPDHCDADAISGVLRDGTVIIAPKDCKEKLSGEITSLTPGEEATVEGIRVKAVQAYNLKRFRSPGKPFHPKGLGVGYLIMVEGRTIYHAGDTDVIPEMKDLGPIDVALLPCGDTYTMDNTEAAEAALIIKPRLAVPMHNWDKDTADFRKRLERKPGIRFMAPKEGDEFVVQ